MGENSNAESDQLMTGHTKRVTSFLMVGGTAFIIDVVIFNTLAQLLPPVGAKAISVSIAIFVSYYGNQLITFRTPTTVRQVVTFVAVNVTTGCTGILCLFVSNTVLHLDGTIADNISANVIGVGLGMAMRYVLYSRIVFRHTITREVTA